jgi:hypothetical protein
VYFTQPVIFSAVARQIPWHRQAAGGGIGMVERDGVVDITDPRGPIASREPARDVAAPDPAFQRGRGLIAQRLGRTDRRALDEPQRGGLGELAHLGGVDHAVALEVAGLIRLPVTVSSLAITLITVRTSPGTCSVSVERVGQSG